MKNKNNIWYVGYGISLALVLLLFFTDFRVEIDMAIGILFSVIFAVSHTQLLHSKMLRDDNEYKRNVLDERNIIIKEKAGNITNMITLILLGCATVLFIALEYIIPAIVIGVIIFVQPIILICISNSIENKM
ncbi:TPA: hypothetical protein QFU79_000233 [Enterococcus faecium]